MQQENRLRNLGKAHHQHAQIVIVSYPLQKQVNFRFESIRYFKSELKFVGLAFDALYKNKERVLKGYFEHEPFY